MSTLVVPFGKYASYTFPTGFISVSFTVTKAKAWLSSVPALLIIKVYSFSFSPDVTYILTIVWSLVVAIVLVVWCTSWPKLLICTSDVGYSVVAQTSGFSSSTDTIYVFLLTFSAWFPPTITDSKSVKASSL